MRIWQSFGVAGLTASLVVGCASGDRASREAAAPPPASEGDQAPVVLGQVPEQSSVAVEMPAPPPAMEDRKERSQNADTAPPAPVAAISTTIARSSAKAAADATTGAITTYAPRPEMGPSYPQPLVNTERYQHSPENAVRRVAEEPVSTFSIDVDTGSYANMRRFLNAGTLPPQDAVRVEEMLNYFDYSYAAPSDRDTPFKVTTELGPSPWNSNAELLRIGIKAYELSAEARPPANLVFLIDVSGSMQSPDKLPLLKNAFRLLTEQLTARDRVSMVVYAGSSGVVLPPTPGNDKNKIRAALDQLEAGGSTNGGQGIQRAYELARSSLLPGGINRVVLATDGDFNVGTVDFEALIDMAERERKSGVALTALGFGTGNYNDQLLERLADAGDGNYAYIDTLPEARKVLVTEMSSTLATVAKDVKIQIEFNPVTVKEYRLIGYENRALAREDFNNDQVDAGEIGAGHRVTALYEIVPTGKPGRIDELRYGAAVTPKDGKQGELAWLRLRYKQPDAASSKLIERAVRTDERVSAERLSADFKFAAGVAAFGQWLRGGKYLNDFDCNDILPLARAGLVNDREGYRREFVTLVELARTLQPAAQEKRVETLGDAR